MRLAEGGQQGAVAWTAVRAAEFAAHIAARTAVHIAVRAAVTEPATEGTAALCFWAVCF